ncbi:MAG: RnfABCDGE type electron transport complex subunit D [Clostridia bacterium]|nr:RnfABCDGE type electron transport complex subunit D [Clostridia bacterium]
MNTMLNISSSPHTRHSWNTGAIMRLVTLSLMPAAIVGVAVHGFNALLVILTAVAAAVLSEFLFDLITGKPNTVGDGSAVVTGLMLALCLSPYCPLYLPILGSVFAIVVVKGCFGGLGRNFLNPALAARCFLLISFGRAMTAYGVDATTTATPMALLKSGEAVNITRMFLGTADGVIGSSVAALLLGGMFLWALDVIHGEICFSVLGGFTLFMALFGGQGFDVKFLLAHLCGGGVVMGAFFMATDYVTSPASKLGQFIYGLLIGCLGALFRIRGGNADSFSYSVIAGNLFVPMIDMYILPKPFAYRRKTVKAGDKKADFGRMMKPVIVLTVITIAAGFALSGV